MKLTDADIDALIEEKNRVVRENWRMLREADGFAASFATQDEELHRLTAEVERLRKALYLCAARCGNPDATAVPRIVIATVKDAIGDWMPQ